MNSFRLISSIVNNPFCISMDYAEAIKPYLFDVIKGDYSDLRKYYEGFRVDYHASHSGGVIAVVSISQVIMKYNHCGDYGLLAIEQLLKGFDMNDRVNAIIMVFDSPGGEASYMPNISATIQNLKTPIYSIGCGMCCSAAYWLASSCKSVFSSVTSDTWGSIGTMMEFRKVNPDYVAPYKSETVYATESKRKNEDYKQALKGNFELVKRNRLDPINQLFIASVQKMRPNAKKEVLEGGIYPASKAIEMGLIDGIMTLEQMVSHISNQTGIL